MTAAPALTRATPRIAASPYARRLARERGIALDRLRGSGPGGRIVAADLANAAPATAAVVSAVTTRLSALATTIHLFVMLQVLDGFVGAGTPFTLEDVALRAAGCALDDVPAAAPMQGAPVALESEGRQYVFADIRKGSLAPLRDRRMAAIASGEDQQSALAALSLRLLPAGDIRPVLMPLLPGRAMRLVLTVGESSAETLLSFDAGAVSEEDAAVVLSRFKAYLEQPLRLLA